MRVPQRWRGLATALLIGVLPALLGAAPDGVRTVDVRRLADSDLVRPVEAVGGVATTGNRTVLQTDPAVRAGVHVEIALNLPAARRRTVARAVLDWYAPGEATARETVFVVPAGGLAGPDLTLALTGAGDPGVLPVAWRVRLLDATGGIVAHRASFLWDTR